MARKNDSDLVTATRLFKEKRLAEAEMVCRRLLERDVITAEVWHLLGLVVFSSGRIEEAADLVDRAVSLAPGYSQAHNNLGNIRRRQGRLEKALDSHLAAVRLNRYSSDYFLNLVATLERLVKASPSRELEKTLPGDRTGPPEDQGRPPESVTDTFSVIVCSLNDGKFRQLTGNYRKIIPNHLLEIIRVPDARSLAEGYNRGFEQASGSIVIFCHDDIEILSRGFASRIARSLEEFDLVGAAGTTRLVGPGWIRAGWPHIHGLIVHHRPNGFSVDIYGRLQKTVPRVQALDGLLIAGKRRVFQKLSFDAQTFDHFHLYDVDLTYTAFRRGLRIAVLNDLGLIHKSRGRFDHNWNIQAQRFLRKYHDLLPAEPPLKPTWAKAVFKEPEKAAAFQKALVKLMPDGQAKNGDDSISP